MIEDLGRYYSFRVKGKVRYPELDVYRVDEGYIIVRSGKHITEQMLYEQYMVTSFLQQRGFSHVAVPVYSDIGSFLVHVERGKIIYICFAKERLEDEYKDMGSFLAHFHEAGRTYPYTPEFINRYGKWKQYWEQMIDQVEQTKEDLINQMDSSKTEPWKRLWIETCFYYIGLGENALQFLSESERDQRLTWMDQPVFAMKRIFPFPNRGFILPFQMVHDHPARDLAELFRYFTLRKGKRAFPYIRHALRNYEGKRSLSVFGKRLVFSRLLFPVHFIDHTKKVLANGQFSSREYKELERMLRLQSTYEQCLKDLHEEWFQEDPSIPRISWL
ncbi:spore coat protein YutH [Melghiribacillus thermohalophilus]|uniref:Spore coat protein YutH n=1 Tax=Melghiribacillus thermohalophilus TaxID=1324956 RepID=A0A4R3MUS2_9BACI|nr:hypothetical protein [Melghiribacillus thermohalophilus]TCT19081.1 spore coat protein YutH [Melghiribacillus thermohalophilus]